MTHHRMRLPAGKMISIGGSPLEPDAEHCVLVPVEHLAEARRHGLTPAPPAPVATLRAAAPDVPDAPTSAAGVSEGQDEAETITRRRKK